jgi:molybdopterin converting factor small subunit
MVTVVLPAVLNRPELSGDIVIDEPVATIGDLLNAIDARYPGLGAEIDPALFSILVNGQLTLGRIAQTPLADGDLIEIVST